MLPVGMKSCRIQITQNKASDLDYHEDMAICIISKEVRISIEQITTVVSQLCFDHDWLPLM